MYPIEGALVSKVFIKLILTWSKNCAFYCILLCNVLNYFIFSVSYSKIVLWQNSLFLKNYILMIFTFLALTSMLVTIAGVLNINYNM